MGLFRSSGNYFSSKTKAANASVSKEANQAIVHDPAAPANVRLRAGFRGLGDKFRQSRHDRKASVHKYAAKYGYYKRLKIRLGRVGEPSAITSSGKMRNSIGEANRSATPVLSYHPPTTPAPAVGGSNENTGSAVGASTGQDLGRTPTMHEPVVVDELRRPAPV